MKNLNKKVLKLINSVAPIIEKCDNNEVIYITKDKNGNTHATKEIKKVDNDVFFNNKLVNSIVSDISILSNSDKCKAYSRMANF